MRSDATLTGPISPAPRLPNGSSVVTTLLEDLLPFYDDGSEGLQHLVARLPMLLEVDRAYIGRLSADSQRFTVTQASMGDWPDLLGHTQSVARLPAFARGTLRSGVQGLVEDAATFPFTPQQRKMLAYAGLGATVVTPIPTAGGNAGALVIDQLVAPRPWDPTILEACKSLAEAIGARIALARSGDHLAVEDAGSLRESARLNVLANIARLVERSTDATAATAELVELLSGLPWVGAVRQLGPKDTSNVVRDALASERLVARTVGTKTIVGIPLVVDGQRFGGIEVMLDERLTELDEQFWRTVQTFAGSAFASALRRGRPRDESLRDTLTGLLNFRSINETLGEIVHASRSSGRPVTVWLVDIEGVDRINRAHGYAIGDDVVGYVGHTFGDAVTERGGTTGRVGGGMFLGIFPGHDGVDDAVQARIAIERIIKNTPGHLPGLSLTVGVSMYPDQASGHDDLLRSARLALYAAKKRGSNSVVVANAKDERWVQDARASFIRIITEQQMPASMQQIRK